MREALLIVAVLGMLGMMFVMALAATKYAEASRKTLERQARERAKREGRDSSEAKAGSPLPGWQRDLERNRRLAVAGVVIALVGGAVIGYLVADALNVDAGRRILLQGGATYIIVWCLIGSLFLVRRWHGQG